MDSILDLLAVTVASLLRVLAQAVLLRQVLGLGLLALYLVEHPLGGLGQVAFQDKDKLARMARQLKPRPNGTLTPTHSTHNRTGEVSYRAC